MSKAKMEPVGPAAPKGAARRPAARERGVLASRMSGLPGKAWERVFPRAAHPPQRTARPHRWMPPIAWALMTLATSCSALSALSSTLALALAGDL